MEWCVSDVTWGDGCLVAGRFGCHYPVLPCSHSPIMGCSFLDGVSAFGWASPTLSSSFKAVFRLNGVEETSPFIRIMLKSNPVL